MTTTDASLDAQRRDLVKIAEQFANQLAQSSDTGTEEAPRFELQQFGLLGLLTAPLPRRYGGLGLGTEAGGHMPLLRVLAAIGGADLALGRLYEGHVNGLILVSSFGTEEQLKRTAEDARAGRLFGVWNTGDRTPMQVLGDGGHLRLAGCKSFATGAAFVERPIVTAERAGWQMTLPRRETAAVKAALQVDRSSWQPLGMERSESFTVNFTGAPLEDTDLIGKPGDFYRDPLFRGGAIRFAAVQAGAVLRLASLFSSWLGEHGRGENPHQLSRLGEITLSAQEAVLWIERAAAMAERALWTNVSEPLSRDMIQTANMTRLAVERLATATMPRVIAGVGAHGLLRPARFGRVLRDLTMYLRQPNPDGALTDVARHSLSEITAPLHGPSLWALDREI